MSKTSILTALSEPQYVTIATLWQLTGIGNPLRGDSYEAICRTLEKGARIVMVYSGNLPVGTVWLTHDHRRLYIHHMAVHPNYQNQGFGRLLMEEALSIAKELKLQAKLEVHEDNEVAYELYKKFGFTTLEGFRSMIKRDTQ